MLRTSKGARRLNERIVLTYTTATTDEFGQTSFGTPSEVMTVWAQVRQMSATKTMMTFQQADVVGLDIELRNPGVRFNGITWNGHDVHFPVPENVDDRGRFLRVSGYYQIDDPTR